MIKQWNKVYNSRRLHNISNIFPEYDEFNDYSIYKNSILFCIENLTWTNSLILSIISSILAALYGPIFWSCSLVCKFRLFYSLFVSSVTVAFFIWFLGLGPPSPMCAQSNNFQFFQFFFKNFYFKYVCLNMTPPLTQAPCTHILPTGFKILAAKRTSRFHYVCLFVCLFVSFWHCQQALRSHPLT